MLESFNKLHDDGPTTRKGSLAVKMYSRWRTDHLPASFSSLRSHLSSDLINMCDQEQESALESCEAMIQYFNNYCDESLLQCLE